ncbi:DNA methylase [Enterococcus columbae]|uniref:Y-family DNA polymerase n=1 Tax=Enterococcus columbae TaxID=1355 RepID=UPI00090F5C65|nr:DNA methylase [Enterococcus columbae]OJG26059.1 hypothetical protein RR47_GL000857 [Enterococcus columbae DSM 7374 = ATCC 51263]
MGILAVYLAIDLKSFYASVECVERNLDPLEQLVVVADQSRSDKTICLAVSPALKVLGFPGRLRLFEAKEKLKQINHHRRKLAPNQRLVKPTTSLRKLQQYSFLAADMLIVPPRMQLYIDYSVKIYQIYLQFVAAADVHVYSIDEVFIDLSPYLKLYNQSPITIAEQIAQEIFEQTGIIATIGIGTNLYLAKVAMDILAKKQNANEHGTRLAYLDEKRYQELLWQHQPLTDFWRIGRGISQRLAKYSIFTMEDLAMTALQPLEQPINIYTLFKEFGIQAELLIDHAFGKESCSLTAIKNYHHKSKSMSMGQVLPHSYPADKAWLIVREMTEQLYFRLITQQQATTHLHLSMVYQKDTQKSKREGVRGQVRFKQLTADYQEMMIEIEKLYWQIVDINKTVKKIYLTVYPVVPYSFQLMQQLSLFDEIEEHQLQIAKKHQRYQKERELYLTIEAIQKKYGKNAVLKASSLLDYSTIRIRNQQIGGHLA